MHTRQIAPCSTFVFGMILAAGVAAADVPDQVSTCTSQAGSNISLILPVGQTFQPAQSQVDAVEFHFQGYGTGSAMVTLNVREDTLAGTIVASEAVNVSMVFDVDQWVRFDFVPPLNLTIDDTYMLELVTPTNTIGLKTECSYVRGALFAGGTEFPADTEFRTFGPCGNGDLDVGEQCDDDTFECCDFPSCQLSSIATECAFDSNECSFDHCDGAGACAAEFAPDPSCSSALTAGLAMTDSSKPGKDSVKFKWKKGPQDPTGTGDPSVDTDYALCVYDGSGALVANGTLAGTPGWIAKSDTKTLYKDKEGLVDNVTAGQVVYTTDNLNVSMSLGGAGLALDFSTGLSSDVTAQIRTSTGGCFGSVFDAVETKKNDGTKFIAKEKN